MPVAEKKTLVREVFDSVATRYDLMNDLMSLGIHRAWKREFIAALAPRPDRTLLDLAGGTGDITFGWLAGGGGPAILSDINAAMLSVGRDRALARGFARGLSFLVADAERLPLPDRTVDTRHRCRSACATAPTSRRCCARRGGCCGRAGASSAGVQPLSGRRPGAGL